MFNPQPKPEPLSKLAKLQAKKEKQGSWKALEKKADEIFSKLIRLRDSDSFGRAKCITCPCIKLTSQMDCGHFMSRKHLSTRWELKNAAAQCKGCNGPKSGMQYEFGLKLDERFGQGTSERMRIKSKNVFRKDPIILKVIIIDLETRYSEMLALKQPKK
jgi:hypothetical protein